MTLNTIKSASQVFEPILKYSYADLDAETAKEAQSAALRIRNRMLETAANFVEVGRELFNIKQRLSHGQFGNWIDAEFDMSMRTAQNFMAAAEMIGSFGMATDVVQAIPQTVLYQLSGRHVPGEIIADLIEDVEAGGKPNVPDLMAKIRAAKSEPAMSKSSNKTASDVEAAAILLTMLKEHLTAALFNEFRKDLRCVKAEIFKAIVMADAGSSPQVTATVPLT